MSTGDRWRWILLGLILLATVQPASGQTILRVDGTAGAGGGNGSAWGASAYQYLQDALTQANVIVGGGGTVQVWVRAGTYMPDRSAASPGGTGSTSATFTMASGVAIYGGFGGFETLLSQRNVTGNVTVLSGDLIGNDAQNFQFRADNSVHVLTANGVTTTARLDGVTVTGGNANSTGGGGLYISGGSPTVVGCTFTSNQAAPAGSDGGGAVRVVSGSPVFTSCTFNGNAAHASTGGGGALCAASGSTVAMTTCTFTSNAAAYGSHSGAVRLDGAGALAGCTFTSNSTGTDPASAGGGAVGTGNGVVTIRNCQFTSSSTSGYGGAVNAGSSTSLVGCVFTQNQSVGTATGGGAVYGPVAIVNCRFQYSYANGTGAAVYGALSLTNCIFEQNQSPPAPGLGIVYMTDPGATVTNCTFYSNHSSSALLYQCTGGTLAVRNSIFWENRYQSVRDEGVQLSAAAGTLAVDRCFVQNWTGALGGTGNIGGQSGDDPHFVDPFGADGEAGSGDEDLRLFAGSPCIDAGSNAFLPADTLDADNDSNTAETLPIDFGGLSRRVDDPLTADTGAGTAPIVDMGAHEFDAATYHVWTNASGGAWDTGSNWYPGIPSSSDLAVLNAAGVYTVSLSSGASINGLTQSRGEVTLSLGTSTLSVTNHGVGGVNIGPWNESARLNVVSSGAGKLDAQDVKVYPRGTLGGSGTVQTTVLRNAGSVDPGGTTPGSLTLIGDYQPFIYSERGVAGNVVIDVEGETGGEYDTLHVQGTMTVAGGLIVRTSEGFDPSPTLNLPIITYTAKAIGRSFDVAYLPGLSSGRFYKIDYLESGSVNLVVLDLGGDVGFGSENQTVSHQITAVARGDLNGDSLIDVAVTTSDGFVVLLFNGGNDGGGNWLGFTGSIQLSSGGSAPAGIAIADFDPLNANGLDIAVTNSGSDSVVVLSRPTAGVWAQVATVALAPGDAPIGIATADFDGNGSVDMATANSGSNTFAMRNNSSGAGISFGAGTITLTEDNPTTIDPWDPDNPKTAASAVVGNSNSSTVTFHPNTGTGTFSASTSYGVGDRPETVLTEDMNNDGLEDIVCVNRDGDSISVMLCSGGQSFYDAVNIPVGIEPRSLALVDVDNDGDLDVAVTAENGASQRVVQLLQNSTQAGDYTVAFVAPLELATAQPPSLLTHGDVDQDGFDDIIALSDSGTEIADNVTVRLNLFRACVADFDRNQFVNGEDFDAFIAVFESGEPSADVNHDTFVTGEDFDFFVEHFVEGC